MRWLAVADDLTGACDLAGNLARPGHAVNVSADPVALRGWHGSAVLDAATRFMAPAQARAAVQRAWQRLPDPRGPRLHYQKIDSTLRGQPGAEIEGFLQATGAPWVAVLPAYPSLGRRVLGGELQVHGQGLMQTEYARDPLSPARGASVRALFPRGSSAHAPLALVRRGAGPLAAWLRRRPLQARFITFDCMDDMHLRAIAGACLAAGARHFAGASALGAALARRLSGPPSPPRPPRLPALLVLGSLSATAFAQLQQGSRDGRFVWEPRLRRHPRGFRALPPARLRALRRLHSQGAAVALSSLASREDLAPWHAEGRRLGLGPQELAARSLKALAKAALAVGGPLPKALWFLAGGHTLESFCRQAGLNRLQVQGQIQLGVPLSLAQGPGAQAWIASRPGGFGGPDDLAHFVERSRA